MKNLFSITILFLAVIFIGCSQVNNEVWNNTLAEFKNQVTTLVNTIETTPDEYTPTNIETIRLWRASHNQDGDLLAFYIDIRLDEEDITLTYNINRQVEIEGTNITLLASVEDLETSPANLSPKNKILFIDRANDTNNNEMMRGNIQVVAPSLINRLRTAWIEGESISGIPNIGQTEAVFLLHFENLDTSLNQFDTREEIPTQMRYAVNLIRRNNNNWTIETIEGQSGLFDSPREDISITPNPNIFQIK